MRLWIGVLLFCVIGHTEVAIAGDSFSSVSAGPSVKAWNYAGYTKDFVINDHCTLYVTGGLGTILFGGGAAWYGNGYDESGFVAALAAGILGYHGGLAYQWKTEEHSYLSLGVTYGMYFIQYEGFLPVLSYEYRF